MRVKSAQQRAETAAFFSTQNSQPTLPPRPTRPSRNRPYCNFCKRPGQYENKCWTKFPHLNPGFKRDPPKTPVLIATQSDEDRVICLMAECESAEVYEKEPEFCLMAKYKNANEPKHSNKWFVDSGCSNHMTYNKSLFSSYNRGHHSPVHLGNSNTSAVAGIGTVDISIIVNGKQVRCRLNNVFHVPDLGYQLLSVPTFDKSGLITTFHSKQCWIRKDSTLLAKATMKGNLYELDVAPATPHKV